MKLTIASFLLLFIISVPSAALAVTGAQQECEQSGGIYSNGHCSIGAGDNVAPGGEPGQPGDFFGTGNAQPAASNDTLVNLLPASSLEGIITIILGLVVQIGSILLVLSLVYVGFLFIQAQGNSEAVTKARTSLVWVVVGGLLLLGAEALSLVIKSTVESL